MIYRFLMIVEVEAEDEAAALARLDGYREFANDCDDEVSLMRATDDDLLPFNIWEPTDDELHRCFVPHIAFVEHPDVARLRALPLEDMGATFEDLLDPEGGDPPSA